MIPTIHPFPARMASELALESLRELKQESVILDPMAGSGTVLRHASDMQLCAIGFDLDPLAVLMSRVWTRPIDDDAIQQVYDYAVRQALSIDPRNISLPWIDDDKETAEFVRYWFAPKQLLELRSWSYVLHNLEEYFCNEDELAAVDVLRIALSRIIITKEQCASLARDTSHSRPHRVSTSSDYSVFLGLDRSLKVVRKRLAKAPPRGRVEVRIGDARALSLGRRSIDAVLTSPPYLNAIDYMRGHRLSLVWLGHRLSDLRQIRGSSIGAERAPDTDNEELAALQQVLGDISRLPSRYRKMIDRYLLDMKRMVAEAARVLRTGGRATFVVGNSCLKGVFVRNADAVAAAANLAGLQLIRSYERDLPSQHRYLPTNSNSALSKRMRTETVLSFTH